MDELGQAVPQALHEVGWRLFQRPKAKTMLSDVGRDLNLEDFALKKRVQHPVFAAGRLGHASWPFLGDPKGFKLLGTGLGCLATKVNDVPALSFRVRLANQLPHRSASTTVHRPQPGGDRGAHLIPPVRHYCSIDA